MVKDVKVREILAESSSLDEATTWLVNEANEAGGRDNITVVAFRLEEGEADEVDEGATLVGPTAAGAGLTADAVRSRGRAPPREASLGGAASGPRPRAAAKPSQSESAASRSSRWSPCSLSPASSRRAIFAARQVYFLGTDEGGRLSLYRGLPYDLPFDIELYSEVTSSPTLVGSLPEDRRDEATGSRPALARRRGRPARRPRGASRRRGVRGDRRNANRQRQRNAAGNGGNQTAADGKQEDRKSSGRGGG